MPRFRYLHQSQRIEGCLRSLASKRNKHRTHKHNDRTDDPPAVILFEDDATDDDSKERTHAFDRNDVGYEEQCEGVHQQRVADGIGYAGKNRIARIAQTQRAMRHSEPEDDTAQGDEGRYRCGPEEWCGRAHAELVEIRGDAPDDRCDEHRTHTIIPREDDERRVQRCTRIALAEKRGPENCKDDTK